MFTRLAFRFQHLSLPLAGGMFSKPRDLRVLRRRSVTTTACCLLTQHSEMPTSRSWLHECGHTTFCRYRRTCRRTSMDYSAWRTGEVGNKLLSPTMKYKIDVAMRFLSVESSERLEAPQKVIPNVHLRPSVQ